MLVAGFLCQYKKESSVKNTTYECGIVPFEDARIKFDIKYFNYAILFLIFDIETIFHAPSSKFLTPILPFSFLR